MITIYDRKNNKTHKFKSYYTASLWLVFKLWTTKENAYRDLINYLLWYWRTGATDVEFSLFGSLINYDKGSKGE